MNDWANLIKMGHEEMDEFCVGRRVRLNFHPYCEGVITEQEPPFGLLAPRYKCKWDKGDETGGFIPSSSLTLI